jgi:hypothetical protein
MDDVSSEHEPLKHCVAAFLMQAPDVLGSMTYISIIAAYCVPELLFNAGYRRFGRGIED